MGNRLSKIVTKTGDDGTTGLGDGSRILKSHPRMEAIGDVDELNVAISLVLSESAFPDGHSDLEQIQHRLFDLGGELSIPDYVIIDESDVDLLENLAETFNSCLPPLTNFIIPGGSELVSRTHMARAICRRAERAVVRLAETEHVNQEAKKYLNRLSDFLFVLARHHAGDKVVLWEPKEKKDV